MTGAIPATAPARRWPPRPESIPAARQFVRSSLAGTPSDVVDEAELLVSELVTNAVLHAHTEVEVRAWARAGRVHVRVRDQEPHLAPAPRERGLDACTGRGLQLVEDLAAGFGVECDKCGKTVWFELWPEAPETPPVADWGDARPPTGPTVPVLLADLPVVLYGAAQRHQEALLRECLLAGLAGQRPHLPPADVRAAQGAQQGLDAGVAAALGPEPEPVGTVRVALPCEAGPAVPLLRRVLEQADAAAADGRLLTRPALPEIRRVSDWLLDEVAAQLDGAPPTPWTEVAEETDTDPVALAPWDATDLRAADVPCVAADDGNRILAVNRAAADLLGWDADALTGRRLTVLIPPEYRERHLAGFTSLLLSGESRILGRPVPVEALHHDGHRVPVRLLIRAQEARDGRTVFVAELTHAER
ncbi:ATP-binding protein [Streptomyces sp. NRRL S-813]|uniref:ATP-binding protein n=1 Tax=Streptomyces sp. NRRL S-813 TaxID=1463919 RepID=UPI00099D33CA|nr:ATP-binding protein [Streptomyces sp. NRRL S-813]